MVADTIRNEYYYDESAGIRQCLTKVLGVANKRLAHQRDKYGLRAGGRRRGPDRRRGGGGPRPRALRRHRRSGRGLPHPPGPPLDPARPEPRARPPRRGAWSPRSGAASSRWATRSAWSPPTSWAGSGRTPSRTPWSRSTRSRPSSISTPGSWPRTARGRDGAFAFEASEVGATYKARTLVPVRPAEPLAGAPDKGPIPLADSAAGAAAAVGVGAARARDAAGSSFGRFVWRIQDLLPHRKPGLAQGHRGDEPHGDPATRGRRPARLHRRRRSACPGRVRHRRAAVAHRAAPEPLRGSASLPGGRGGCCERLRARGGPDHRRSVEGDDAADRGLRQAGRGRGRRLPGRRDRARCAPRSARGSTASTASSRSARPPSSPSRADTPVQLEGLVRGYDGAPYVLDSAGKTVWRIDLAKKTAAPVAVSGQKASGTKVADPKVITTGGPDVVFLDTKNNLWRWRPLTRQRQGDAREDQCRGLCHVGQRHHGDVDLRGELRRRALQALRRGPVRAEHHGHLAVERRVGIPGEADAPPADRPPG